MGPNSEASNFLSRQRRANGPVEEILPSNINRECQLEQCDFEEYVEAKENETKQNGVNLRDNIKNKPNMKEEFEAIYTTCYQAVLSDDELKKSREEDGFNFLDKCLEVLNSEFEEKGYFGALDVTTDYTGG